MKARNTDIKNAIAAIAGDFQWMLAAKSKKTCFGALAFAYTLTPPLRILSNPN